MTHDGVVPTLIKNRIILGHMQIFIKSKRQLFLNMVYRNNIGLFLKATTQ